MKKTNFRANLSKKLVRMVLSIILFTFFSPSFALSNSKGIENNAFKISSNLLVEEATSFRAMQATITGTVTDEAGIPLSGVSVVVKGTTIGVVTDFDGEYAIELPSGNNILVFSYLGMTEQEVTISNNTVIDITMQEDVTGLEEVIVVGYGSQKKSDLTGSVARANIENFSNQPNVSIMQSLQGSVAGINVGAVNSPGENPSFTVRGRNTFAEKRDRDGNLTPEQPNDPLIVLDGIIYRGSIIDINPSDVLSVDVLKDASSKAIYGSQAANGVLIITTKGGKRERKPVFNISSSYTVETPSNRLHPLNRREYIQKASDLFWEDAYLEPNFTQVNPDFDPNSTFTLADITDGFNNGTDTDWLDLATRTGSIKNTNVSMAGSTEKTSYFISAGITEQDGYVKNDEYSRLNLRVNFESKVRDWLTLGMQNFMSSGDYSGASANLRNAIIYSPLIEPFNEDGSLNLFPQGNDISPLAALEVNNEDKRLNLFGNMYADVQLPIEGLSYRINYSTNYRTRRENQFNKFGNNELGSAFKFDEALIDRTIDNILTYKRTFNKKHDVDVTLLYGTEKRKGDETRADSGIFLNPVLGFNSLESGDPEQQLVSSAAFEENSLYQMGRLAYKFNNKYLANFTIRRDGFSGFGSDKKYGTFPSAAFAWVASSEDFVAKALPWANNLKLRATYGQSGNRTVFRYQTLASVDADFVYVFGDGGSSAYGQNISSLSNNSLSWETTTGLNFGLDFSVLDNRISGTIDYYDNKTEDILVEINLPRITGFSTIPTNIGEVANKGIELTLSSINVKTDNFTWKSTVIFTANDNEIVSILGRDNDNDGDGREDDLIANGLFIGESIGAINSYIVDGIYQIGDDIPDGFQPGQYKLRDLNGDGEITPLEDRAIIGRTEPAYRFSIFNDFRYKNFSLTTFINSVQGGKNGYLGNITPTSGQFGEFGWTPNVVNNFNTVREFDYWTPQNPNAEFTGLRYTNPIDPSIYRDRSFVRLQDVNLSYSFPKKLLEKYAVQDLRIFLSGKNLYTWTDWNGIDPEAGIGLQPFRNPVMSSYSLGFNLTF